MPRYEDFFDGKPTKPMPGEDRADYLQRLSAANNRWLNAIQERAGIKPMAFNPQGHQEKEKRGLLKKG